MKHPAGKSCRPIVAAAAAALAISCAPEARASGPQNPWPAITGQCKPWAYWWWMGSAVDQTNVTRELRRYSEAGMGGVHIIPIYGAKGFEDRFVEYLSPPWMQMLDYTVTEADRLGLGVDMTTGTGWCFGGPQVTDREANASVVVRNFVVGPGARLSEKLDPGTLQALVAFSAGKECQDLTRDVAMGGAVEWAPANGTWQVYAVSQRPSGQKVKRAGPGGQGHMLNLIYPEAMEHYLGWFDGAFARHTGRKPRAVYHDSYEYRSDWAPDLLTAFEKRRGYRLQTELQALLSGAKSSGTNKEPQSPADADRAARVKSDYRETVSDVMVEESLPLWAQWSRRHGFLTRNEAHGSPGNWLDLYALADIPETEMFHTDRNKLVSKFASSAAHVAGRNLVSAETGTWLAEHFTETLADMKYLVDDLLLSGVNHLFYHGTCYSPDEAAWPGWLFYASYEMNPRNSIWRDVPALNAYVTRCQSVLQSGQPDNDILLYWPIYDTWHSPAGMVRNLTVHARDWLEDQPIGKTAGQLWSRGYAFDYISDRQVTSAQAKSGRLKTAGGAYRLIVVPPSQHMPLATLRKLLELAQSGATVVFEDQLPADVPGWGQLAERRREFQALLAPIKPSAHPGAKVQTAKYGKGRVFIGGLGAALTATGVSRESMFDQEGLMCVRRVIDGGRYYFIANRSEKLPVKRWVPLAHGFRSVAIMDPRTGQFGAGATRESAGASEVFLSLAPGESVILRCLDKQQKDTPKWNDWNPVAASTELTGTWEVEFIQGGPELPAPFQMRHLGSWTTLTDTNAQRFAGTALYRLTFDAPGAPEHALLDLGKVCQSARVRLNGQELGTLFTPPFQVVASSLKSKSNLLEVEVTNISANRIRDLDQRRVSWKTFQDINFVGIDYKAFDASNWPLTESGLMGPLTLTPVRLMEH